ncbi:hypothetical protein PoB_007250400 [Plakobranchus ocellatus]|uniref:Uncharacterized protein n=1 Tax=Plakobranchus ocellatus TaxID=259542 RepID=A0AAV4DP63_9GAST|nr:hypothetical protein PoB_007250400 [Plakobranchus ocellatus]
MDIPEDHIHHENQDDASIEGQAEQENYDLLHRPQQGRELQEEGKLKEKTRKLTYVSIPMTRTYKSEDEKEPGNSLNGKGTYKND